MNTTDLSMLRSGTRYRVKIVGHQRSAIRIFKWLETRLASIPCAVFTSPVKPDVSAAWDPEKKTLSLSGKKLPASEVSVPHYDIDWVEPIASVDQAAPLQICYAAT